MKWRNSYAVVAGCTAVSLMALDAQAQSLKALFWILWAGIVMGRPNARLAPAAVLNPSVLIV